MRTVHQRNNCTCTIIFIQADQNTGIRDYSRFLYLDTVTVPDCLNQRSIHIAEILVSGFLCVVIVHLIEDGIHQFFVYRFFRNLFIVGAGQHFIGACRSSIISWKVGYLRSKAVRLPSTSGKIWPSRSNTSVLAEQVRQR